MTDRNRNTEEQNSPAQTASSKPRNNPFENNQPVDQEIAQSQEELEKEQAFKEAQTERD